MSAEATPTPPAGAATDLATAAQPDVAAEPKKKKKKPRRKRGPGVFADLHQDSKDVLDIDIFTGARFTLNNMPIAPATNISMNSSFDQTSQEKKCFELSGTTDTQIGSIFAKIDDRYNLLGRHDFNLTKHLSSRATLSNKGALTGSLNLEQKTLNYAGTLNLVKSSGLKPFCALSYMQNLTRRIAVGAELTTKFLPDNTPKFGGSAGARYKQVTRKLNCVATAQAFSNGSAKVNYTQKFQPHISLTSQFLLAAPRTVAGKSFRDTEASVGALYDWQAFKFQGALRSSGEVCARFQTVLNPEYKMVTIVSGSLNHITKRAQFGFGFSMSS